MNTEAKKTPAPRGKKVKRVCKYCRDPFMARIADVKRGWAMFCSKSCKASSQESRTGQHADYLRRQAHAESGE